MPRGQLATVRAPTCNCCGASDDDRDAVAEALGPSVATAGREDHRKWVEEAEDHPHEIALRTVCDCCPLSPNLHVFGPANATRPFQYAASCIVLA